ncbi:MAG: hypothetical protein AB7K36_21985 [Chloroflexota bacterium]
MWLRANIALAMAVLLALVQMFASVTGGFRIGDTNALASSPNNGLTRSVAAADDDNDDEDNEDEDNDDEDEDDEDNADDDNEDSDNEDDDEDSDNEDSDNEDSDNEDEDNDDEDSDNDDEDSDNEDEDFDDELDDELDNVEPDDGVVTDAPAASQTYAPSAAPYASPGAALPPLTEAQMVTAGMDATLALQTDRVVVKVFTTMPPDITLKLRMVDPLAYPATPGIRAGDLIFMLEATDSMGTVLQTLPAEVNLSVHYTDLDVTGLNDTAITMSRLDPFDSTWKPAAKLFTDPLTNYVAGSILETGVYAVYVP